MCYNLGVMKRKLSQRNNGFTVLELVVVVVAIIILLAVVLFINLNQA